MKKILLTCASVCMLASAASATTFSPLVTANAYRQAPASSGLQTRATTLSNTGPQAFTGATYSFDLNAIGDSVSKDIYGLVAFDSPIDPDDVLPRPSTATFDFGALGSVTVLGTSMAVGSGTVGYAIATFVSDFIRVSATEGIKISISDTIFATDSFGNFVTGSAGKGVVNATFTLAAVPLPAALPLSLGALGLMGFVGRRRKSKTAA
jgi:hypothetical protein